MKKSLLYWVLLSGVLLYLSPPVSAETITCLVCHSAMKGKVKTEKGVVLEVNINEERFSKSVHGSLDCTTCHKTFQTNPHEAPPKGSLSPEVADLVGRISSKALTDPVAYASCLDCHREIYQTISESVHGKNIMEKKRKDGALCKDCHGSPHYIFPAKSPESMVNKWKIVETCAACHGNEEKAREYGINGLAVETYKENFHGRKHQIGHGDAPTCINCHGAHNIKKWSDPSSLMSVEKRIETCGKCHPGATKKFVTAITHKPLGKDNPIPYYGEKGLILLTMGTFAFIVSHVLLDAFADIRDRLFRKDKEDSRHD
jgi:hypothetical protein